MGSTAGMQTSVETSALLKVRPAVDWAGGSSGVLRSQAPRLHLTHGLAACLAVPGRGTGASTHG